MATFIDEDTNNEEEQFDEVNQQEPEEVTPEESAVETEEEEDEIPEKYKGKSVKDIVRMHQEAERALGKQGTEVGELRRVVDDFIRAQSVPKQQAPEVEDEADFFENPQQAIAKAIEKHPKVKQAEQLAAQMQRAEALANLQAAHPDFKQILQNESFGEWIAKSQVRKELFQRADQRYDFAAADELLTTWKERTQVVQQAKDVEKISRKQAVKSAATGTGKGSGESSSKKIYRRQDILELMQKDPERYLALSPEIQLAYAEKRVR